MTKYQFYHTMTLQRRNFWDMGEVTVTPGMLRVLAAVDGKSTLTQIMEKLGLSSEELCNEVGRLHSLHLIDFAFGEKEKPVAETDLPEEYFAPPPSLQQAMAEA